MATITPPIVHDDAVTASDLARHFGQWQRRALQAPVYVLHHGRPQFVLASIEFMQALSATGPARSHDEVAELLDALSDPILICDPEGAVLAAGRAARLCFGKAAQPGARLDAILDDEAASFLSAVVARVAHGSIAERAKLPGTADRPQLDVVVEPSGSGVIVIFCLSGIADARDAAEARAAALAEAVAALPGHAAFAIDLRGRLLAPDTGLASLTGLSSDELSSGSLVRLFADPSRSAIDDALDAVFAGGGARSIDGDLFTGGRAMPVTLALAPLRRGLTIEAVQAIMTRRNLV